MFRFNWIYTKRQELFAKIQVQYKITRKLMLACLCYEFSIYGTDHELKKRADIENLVRKRLATGGESACDDWFQYMDDKEVDRCLECANELLNKHFPELAHEYNRPEETTSDE